MAHDHSHHDHGNTASESFWTSRAFLVFLGFAAMAIVLLWEEHRAHFLGVIPYLFVLACPLMHIFMHGGHDHGGRHDQGQSPRPVQTGSERDGGKS
jgi:cell division protein FtsW (lipid II flippase)